MRFIPTKTHALLDYLSAIVLFTVPPMIWDADTPMAWAPMLVGAVTLIQSLFTDYELSISNTIPVPVHLGIDAAVGLFLAASPWLFGFAQLVWLPHLVVGLAEMCAAATTELHRRERYEPMLPDRMPM